MRSGEGDEKAQDSDTFMHRNYRPVRYGWIKKYRIKRKKKNSNSNWNI